MTQEPHPTIPELKLAREHGATRGLLDGQRDAISRVEAEAYLDAYHGQMQAAGLCVCDQLTAAQASPAAAPGLDIKGLADTLSSFLTELNLTLGMLQSKPAEEPTAPAAVELVHVVASPELSREVNGILDGLTARTRARKAEALAAADLARQVDADEAPAVPARHALDIDPVPQLATGGIVKPRIDVDGLLQGGVA